MHKKKLDLKKAAEVEMARKTSLIDKLVQQSDLVAEMEYDQEKIRRRVVPEKSMFKDKRALFHVFGDQVALFNAVVGNKPDY